MVVVLGQRVVAAVQNGHGVRLRVFEDAGDGRRQLQLGGRRRYGGAGHRARRGGAGDRDGRSFFYSGDVGGERASFAGNRVLPIGFPSRNDYLLEFIR